MAGDHFPIACVVSLSAFYPKARAKGWPQFRVRHVPEGAPAPPNPPKWAVVYAEGTLPHVPCHKCETRICRHQPLDARLVCADCDAATCPHVDSVRNYLTTPPPPWRKTTCPVCGHAGMLRPAHLDQWGHGQGTEIRHGRRYRNEYRSCRLKDAPIGPRDHYLARQLERRRSDPERAARQRRSRIRAHYGHAGLAVWTRQNGTCQGCGADYMTRNVHLHHIDLDHHHNEEENLVCLCASCHQFVHRFVEAHRAVDLIPARIRDAARLMERRASCLEGRRNVDPLADRMIRRRRDPARLAAWITAAYPAICASPPGRAGMPEPRGSLET